MSFKTDPFFIASLEPREEPVPIIIVVGRICAGKDTFAQTLAEHIQIDVGDIVREITQTQMRVQKSELDVQIIPILIDRIRKQKPVVVTGLRQVSILTALLREFNVDDFELVFLDTPYEERRRRFVNRGAAKDILSFDEYEARDKEIGLDILINALPLAVATVGQQELIVI